MLCMRKSLTANTVEREDSLKSPPLDRSDHVSLSPTTAQLAFTHNGRGLSPTATGSAALHSGVRRDG